MIETNIDISKPTTQSGPERWATQVHELVTSRVKEGLDEYRHARLYRLPSIPPVVFTPDEIPTVQNPVGYSPTFTLKEISNYYTLELTRTDEEFQEELLSKSVRVANEISTIVNFLIREQAKEFGFFDYKRQLDKVSAVNIFKKLDDQPNLKLNVANSVSAWDSDGATMGWIAYKFLFACSR